MFCHSCTHCRACRCFFMALQIPSCVGGLTVCTCWTLTDAYQCKLHPKHVCLVIELIRLRFSPACATSMQHLHARLWSCKPETTAVDPLLVHEHTQQCGTDANRPSLVTRYCLTVCASMIRTRTVAKLLPMLAHCASLTLSHHLDTLLADCQVTRPT